MAGSARGTRAAAAAPMADRVRQTLAALERRGSARRRDEMLPRYGITARQAFGVSMTDIRLLARRLGTDHALAVALWKTGCYEARLLAAFVDDPDRLTVPQMDRWCRDFDSWGVCDTLCFHLFDRSPLALGRVRAWAPRRAEYQRRAAFALLASLALHRKKEDDAVFLRCLPLIERAAGDGRNFVKKGVSWALRSVGHRSRTLHTASVTLAERLAASPEPARRWVGNDTLRDLRRPAVLRRLKAR